MKCVLVTMLNIMYKPKTCEIEAGEPFSDIRVSLPKRVLRGWGSSTPKEFPFPSWIKTCKEKGDKYKHKKIIKTKKKKQICTLHYTTEWTTLWTATESESSTAISFELRTRGELRPFASGAKNL